MRGLPDMKVEERGIPVNVLDAQMESGVLTLTMNRPERLNALNDALQTALIEALQAAGQDDEVRVIVLSGAGRGFCAGLDLTEAAVQHGQDQSRAARLDPYGWVGRLALAVAACDKPVIAAINGTAAGAGLALALACDLRLMADTAKITAGYIRRGLSPDAGLTYFLPRLIGQARAAEFVLTGRDMDADEAQRVGLVARVTPLEALAAQTRTLAQVLAAGPPLALTLSKRLLLAGQELTLEETLKREYTAIKMCFATKDVQEGVLAFAQKRAPVFKGE